MTRRSLITGILLLASSLAVFLYKTTALDTPLRPSDPKDLWQVELSISARGDGSRGSLRAPLPSSDGGQVIFDERSSSDGLNFSIRAKQGGRTGVWSGAMHGVQRVVYGFRVKLTPEDIDVGGLDDAPVPEAVGREALDDSIDYPKSDPDIQDLLGRLALPPPGDAIGRIRALQAFVAEEIATVDTASHDALLTLAQSEGSALGKSRLLTTLIRAAGLPARLALGLKLKETGPPALHSLVEAHVGGRWLAVSSAGDYLGVRPPDLLVLRRGEGDVIDSVGTDAVGYQFRARRERLRPEELATVMVPTNPVFAALSLYRLPLSTQESLRLLLLLPLGALLVSAWRNLVGITTYGTFLPVLLALSLRSTSTGFGLTLVGVILGVGIAGRVWVDRLRLLVVPRLSILLCLVVLAMTGLTLLGERFAEPALFAGVVFPVVILTLLIERFSLTLAETGARNAIRRIGYTLAVALVILPVFRSEAVIHLMFGFPELVIGVIGLLTLLGGYTGYRLVDLRRFHSLVLPAGDEGP